MHMTDAQLQLLTLACAMQCILGAQCMLSSAHHVSPAGLGKKVQVQVQSDDYLYLPQVVSVRIRLSRINSSDSPV